MVRLSLLITVLSLTVTELLGNEHKEYERARGAAGVGTSQPLISDAYVAADSHLKNRISLAVRQTTCGELLELISQKSGIPVAADMKDGSADVSMAVFCSDYPVYRILNGIWSLLSYKGALWSWERSGVPGEYTYQLLQPRAARSLRHRMQDWATARIQSDARTLIKAVDGTADEQRAALEGIYGTSEITREFAVTPEAIWMNVRAVKDALSSRELATALQSGRRYSKSINSIRPPVKGWFLNQWRQMNKGSRYFEFGVEKPEPEPDLITFEFRKYGSTPAFCATISGVPSPWLFGGLPLEREFRERIGSLWMLDGDQNIKMLPDHPMQRPVDAIPEPPSRPPTPKFNLKTADGIEDYDRWYQHAATDFPVEGRILLLARRLHQLAQGARMPVIARLPEDEPSFSLTLPWGRKVTEYWAQVWNKPLMVKLRDGVQLVSTESWPFEDAPIPLWLTRALRKDAIPGELLPFEYLAAAAALLSRAQLLRLKGEFPVMERVANAQGMLAFLHQFPHQAQQALTERGVAISSSLRELMMTAFPRPLAEAAADARAAYLTVRIIHEDAAGSKVREVLFEIRAADGHRIRGLGFVQPPQPQVKIAKPPVEQKAPAGRAP